MAKMSFADAENHQPEDPTPEPAQAAPTKPKRAVKKLEKAAQPAVEVETTVVEDTEGTVTEPPENTASEMAPVPQNAQAPAHYVDGDELNEDEEYGRVQWPSLTLVHKTSKRIGEFAEGDLVVLDYKVGGMGQPLEVVAIKATRAFQEVRPFDPNAPRPQIFRTSKEAHEAGFVTEYVPKGDPRPQAKPIMGILFWIEQPEGVDEPHIFMFEAPNGKKGAVVKYFAARTAYTSVGAKLDTARQTYLRPEVGGLVAGKWSMTVTRETGTVTTYVKPHIHPAGKTAPELQEYLRSLVATK